MEELEQSIKTLLCDLIKGYAPRLYNRVNRSDILNELSKKMSEHIVAQVIQLLEKKGEAYNPESVLIQLKHLFPPAIACAPAVKMQLWYMVKHYIEERI